MGEISLSQGVKVGLVASFLVLFLAGCGKSLDDKLQGSWKRTGSGATSAVRFKDSKMAVARANGRGSKEFGCDTPYSLDGSKLKVESVKAASGCTVRSQELEIEMLEDSQLTLKRGERRVTFTRMDEAAALK